MKKFLCCGLVLTTVLSLASLTSCGAGGSISGYSKEIESDEFISKLEAMAITLNYYDEDFAAKDCETNVKTENKETTQSTYISGVKLNGEYNKNETFHLKYDSENAMVSFKTDTSSTNKNHINNETYDETFHKIDEFYYQQEGTNVLILEPRTKLYQKVEESDLALALENELTTINVYEEALATFKRCIQESQSKENITLTCYFDKQNIFTVETNKQEEKTDENGEYSTQETTIYQLKISENEVVFIAKNNIERTSVLANYTEVFEADNIKSTVSKVKDVNIKAFDISQYKEKK